MKKLLIVFSFFFFAPTVLGAIAFDAETTGVSNGQIQSASWVHTTTGSDILLCVYVFQNDQGGVVTGVTYNGDAMTLLEYRLRSNYALQGFSQYCLENADVGAHSVAITTSGSSTASWAWAVSYTGVDSIETDGSSAGNGGSNTVSVTTTDDAVLIGADMNFDSNAITVGTNVTNTRISSSDNITAKIGDSIGTTLTAGSNEFTFTSTSVWAVVVASALPATGGGGGTPTTESATTTEMVLLGSISFGIGILIVIFSLYLIIAIWGHISVKKPWR